MGLVLEGLIVIMRFLVFEFNFWLVVLGCGFCLRIILEGDVIVIVDEDVGLFFLERVLLFRIFVVEILILVVGFLLVKSNGNFLFEFFFCNDG